MVDRKGKGKRRKSRDKLSKHVRDRGKVRIRDILRKFGVGDMVHIKLNPSFHKGMPHHKFHGRTGLVVGIRGECYEILVSDGKKKKIIISHPAHLKPVGYKSMK